MECTITNLTPYLGKNIQFIGKTGVKRTPFILEQIENKNHFIITLRGSRPNRKTAIVHHIHKNGGDTFEEIEDMSKKITKYRMLNDPYSEGVIVGTDASNLIIFQPDGTDDLIRLKSKDELEEIVPYTIRLKKLIGSNISIHILVEKDDFEIGDLLSISSKNDSNIFVVCELNTKNKTAKKATNVHRFQKEKLNG